MNGLRDYDLGALLTRAWSPAPPGAAFRSKLLARLIALLTQGIWARRPHVE